MNETKGSKTLFETTTETQKLLSKLLPFPPFFLKRKQWAVTTKPEQKQLCP